MITRKIKNGFVGVMATVLSVRVLLGVLLTGLVLSGAIHTTAIREHAESINRAAAREKSMAAQIQSLQDTLEQQTSPRVMAGYIPLDVVLDAIYAQETGPKSNPWNITRGFYDRASKHGDFPAYEKCVKSRLWVGRLVAAYMALEVPRAMQQPLDVYTIAVCFRGGKGAVNAGKYDDYGQRVVNLVDVYTRGSRNITMEARR